MQRPSPSLSYRIGCDEAGRGPLAGPVVGAAVCFPPRYRNREIDDSKKLSPEKRDYLYEIICRDAISFSIIAVGARRIEQINILQASLLAMKIACGKVASCVGEPIAEILVDGNKAFTCAPPFENLPVKAIIGGDASKLCIGAASILAKVHRDRLMKKLHDQFPYYGFAQHAGYGTERHRLAISEFGICRQHRRTFAGVSEHTHRPLYTREDCTQTHSTQVLLEAVSQ